MRVTTSTVAGPLHVSDSLTQHGHRLSSHPRAPARRTSAAQRIPENARRGVVLRADSQLPVFEGVAGVGDAGEGVGLALDGDEVVVNLFLARLTRQRMVRALYAAFRVHRSPRLRSVGRYDLVELLRDALHGPRRPEGARHSPSLLGRNRRMVPAAQCGRVRASLEMSAVRAPLGGPEGCFGATDRSREQRGPPLGGPNTSFSPKSTPWHALSGARAPRGLELDHVHSYRRPSYPRRTQKGHPRVLLGENPGFWTPNGSPRCSLQRPGDPKRRSGPPLGAWTAGTSSDARTRPHWAAATIRRFRARRLGECRAPSGRRGPCRASRRSSTRS